MSFKYCCCGQVGTFIIALICLVYSALSILGGASLVYTVANANENNTDLSWPDFAKEFARYSYFYTVGSLIEAVLLFLTSVLLIYGNRARKSSLYWPFIIYQIVSLLLSLARLAAVVYVLINTLITDNGRSREQREQGILALSVISFILILLFVFQCYFLWVVIRGRKFLVEDNKIQKSVTYNPYHSGGTLVDQPYYQYHRQWNSGHRPTNTPSYVYY